MKRPPKIRVAGYRLIRESVAEYLREPPVKIALPKDVFTIMESFVETELTENFWILMLDTQHKMMGGPVVASRGILNSSLVHPREIFKAAIVTNASAIILVHNHPSGDPTPSEDDKQITLSLVEAGRLLDIPVVDHLIVCPGRYISFAESGLLYKQQP